MVRSGGGDFDPAAIYRSASPGVVTISANVGGEPVDGSGFVVSADGHVITNAHVVTDSPDHTSDAARCARAATSSSTSQDGNTLPAKLIGFDLFDDIAVLKVDPTREPLTVLRFGKARSLQVGEPLAVIGSPFGEDQQESLSVGVVSAAEPRDRRARHQLHDPGRDPDRRRDQPRQLRRPGRSIATATSSASSRRSSPTAPPTAPTGVSFAVPAESVQRSFNELVASGKVQLRLARRRAPGR